MKAYLVIVLEDKDKVQYQLINHHQPSSIIINHHQWPSMMINEHQWSSIIINDHQWSSIKEWIFTIFLIFRSLRRRRRTGVNCHFFTKVGKLLTLAPDVRLRFLKKGKWSELNFRNFWPGSRHLRPFPDCPDPISSLARTQTVLGGIQVVSCAARPLTLRVASQVVSCAARPLTLRVASGYRGGVFFDLTRDW